ncbi:MAG: cyanophycinase [Lentisphaerae bacterium GWF2_38_69]|nr:MAG: cyanophycinase [Lentisphaerae bacterium GWF2_38_69]
MKKKTEIKGKLIAIGGNEDKNDEMKVLRRVVDEAKGKETVVELITTASDYPRWMSETYETAFKRIGINLFDYIDVSSRSQADDKKYEERLNEADLIFFTGGDQLRLSSVLKDSLMLETIQRRLLEGAVVAGTSAGASAISDLMIYEGNGAWGLVKGSISMGPGLGFISNLVIDTHFVTRNRFGRLFQVASAHESILGVGLSDDTGIIIDNDEVFEVFGNGLVVVVDNGHLKDTNISRIEKGDLLSVENLHVHVLGEGYKYNFVQRSFL